MASSTEPGPGKPPEGLAELGKLIESALARHGASARAIAARAGIGASHLSKFLKAKRSLRRAKLMILADLLGLDRDKVLRLAGFAKTEQPRLELSRVTLLRTMGKFTLNAVVTPRSYDGAMFMWMFHQRPFAEVGGDSQLRRVEWTTAPAELASYTYAVGLHTVPSPLFRLGCWNHLTLYRGDALIERGTGSHAGGHALSTLRARAKEKGSRLALVAFDPASVERVRGALAPGGDLDVQIVPNPDIALEAFRAGTGDLFLAGLAQRLVLRGDKFHEIKVEGMESVQMHSLICSEQMLAEKRPFLHAIEGLWYDTCRRLYAEPEFRSIVFNEITDLLERHGIEKHSLSRPGFELLFSEAGRSFEVFPQTPAELWEAERSARASGT